jgi:hypothetical protein
MNPRSTHTYGLVGSRVLNKKSIMTQRSYDSVVLENKLLFDPARSLTNIVTINKNIITAQLIICLTIKKESTHIIIRS